MREERDHLKTPKNDSPKHEIPHESEEHQKIDQIADDAAKKGQETEKEYDQTHRIPAIGPGGIS